MKMKKLYRLFTTVCFTLSVCFVASAQIPTSATVVDQQGNPIGSVNIFGSYGVQTSTDIDGQFQIKLPKGESVVIQKEGYESKLISVSDLTGNIILEKSLFLASEDDEIKMGVTTSNRRNITGSASVINTKERQVFDNTQRVRDYINGLTLGVRNSDNIRGIGTAVFVIDGVLGRDPNVLNMEEVDQITILKDANAVALYGSRARNGVIVINTKRGEINKNQVNVNVRSGIRAPISLPKYLDAAPYMVLFNEARNNDGNDATFSNETIINTRDGVNPFEFPDVDLYSNEFVEEFVSTSTVITEFSGGNTKNRFYVNAGWTRNQAFVDINDDINAGSNRFNLRGNLDFKITSSTKVSVNISGYYGVQEKPISDITKPLNGLYNIASSLYTPLYPDGLYGDHVSGESNFRNPLIYLTQRGDETSNKIGISSDFIIDQKLNFITKGLSLNASLSYDNNTTATKSIRDRGDNDYDNVIYRIYDADGNEIITSPDGANDFDYVIQPWTPSALNVSNGSKFRRLTYQGALNYKRTFADKHNTSGLFLFQREESARGSVFASFREDWVGRITYNYDNKYFLDVNGAYNGSEKFGPGYRFELFPSAAAGWMVSNENFMSNADWLNTLKIRGSYGLVGDDRANGNRFLYDTRWENGGSSFLVPSHIQNRSPYVWYSEQVAGNPELQWETSLKSNIGIDLGFFQNAITAQFDYFSEKRENIFITGTSRNVPDFFGFAPPAANTGIVHVNGFEFVLGLKHTFANELSLFSDFSYTRAKDKVIAREDPELKPIYQKAAGYIIGQPRAAIAGDILASWDDIYMSTPTVNDQSFRRPGYYDVVDYNGNGNYNSTDDNAPIGYSDRPQNTWTWNVGGSYKGFNLMLMFYGSQNANRTLNSRTFNKETYLFFDYLQDYWSPDNQDASLTLQPWTLDNGASDPMRNRFDASVVRLRTVEFAYDIPKSFCSQMGVSSMRLFVNGNNLFLWTDLPDDREFNGSNSQDSDRTGDYPTLRRINFGFNLNF